MNQRAGGTHLDARGIPVGEAVKYIIIGSFAVLVVLSLLLRFSPGIRIGRNFVSFAFEMLKILPCAFILIGLFEVWVKRETVERHLGKESSIRGYLWAILLAGTTVGGLYVAFPVAYALFRKGAKLSVIFTYLGASAIARVPMTVFEASYMGVKFTAIRLFVSIPLVILSAAILGQHLEKRHFEIREGGASRTTGR